MKTALPLMPNDLGWSTNGGGFHFHRLYGAGLVQAAAAVELGRHWTNLPVSRTRVMTKADLGLAIPDNTGAAATVKFDVTGVPMRVEHVRVIVDATHLRRGQLQFTLTSPSGMTSRLADRHDDRNDDWEFWTFMSRRHWGENATGTWRLEVKDVVTRTAGRLNFVRLELLGTLPGAVDLVEASWMEAGGAGLRDGVISPGELIEERVVIRNVGTTTLDGLVADVSASDPAVTLIQARASYPSIPPGGTATNTEPFVYRVEPSFATCGGRFQLEHRIAAAGLVTTNVLRRDVGAVLGAPATFEYPASEGLPLTVLDRGTVYATNSIDAGERVIDDVTVSLRLDHPTVGDTQITLIHPDGTEVSLAENRGGNSPNMGTGECGTGVPTLFTDSATMSIREGEVPFAGSYRPESPLSALRGKPLSGVWRLRLSDVYDDDSGLLKCWSILPTTRPVTANCAPYVPLRMVSYERRGDGSFRLVGEGLATHAVRLEASDDLVRWGTVVVQEPSGTTFELIDAEAGVRPHRFYRVSVE